MTTIGPFHGPPAFGTLHLWIDVTRPRSQPAAGRMPRAYWGRRTYLTESTLTTRGDQFCWWSPARYRNDCGAVPIGGRCAAIEADGIDRLCGRGVHSMSKMPFMTHICDQSMSLAR